MDEQYGFRSRRGVGDCVFAVKRLQEAFKLQGHPLYLAFLDISKAYDSVPREALFRILEQRYGVDERAMRLLRALYKDTQGQVRVGTATSAPFTIDTGVRQGCIISPLLFSVYLDFLLRSSQAECRALGIEWEYARDTVARAQAAVQDRTWVRCPLRLIITMILYADDMVVWADSAAKLQQMVTILAERLAAGEMLLSAAKSKVMVTGATRGGAEMPAPITISGEALEVVQTFKYLGTIISADGTDKEDVRQRIGRAWASYYDKGKTLRERRMGTKVRTNILYTSVISVLLHGCEHWRLTPEMEADLVSAHHGMLLGILGLTRKQAADQGITRAEALVRTGANDIVALIERRVLRQGTKLMLVHRAAPSLPSILFAGQPATLRYPVSGGKGARFWRRDGRNGAPLHWEGEWLRMLDTYLDPPGRAELTDAVVKEAAYGGIEERPLEWRAKARVRCPHCGIMQNGEQERQQHILWRHEVDAAAGAQDDTRNQGAPAATGGADGRQTEQHDTQRSGSNGNGTRGGNSSNNTGDDEGEGGGGQRRSRSPYLLRSRAAASQH